MLLRNIGLALACFASGYVQAQSVTFDYQTRYVTEGRDNLGDGGIAWVIANLPSVPLSSLENLSLVAEYGIATASTLDYDELVLSAVYSENIGQLCYSIGLSRLQFFDDDAFDNELFARLSGSLIADINSAIEIIYSTEQNGSFLLVNNERSFDVNSQLSITPYIAVGFDFGYASPDFDGLNHWSLGASADYTIFDDSAVGVTYQWDIRGSDIKTTSPDAGNQHWISLRYSQSF